VTLVRTIRSTIPKAVYRMIAGAMLLLCIVQNVGAQDGVPEVHSAPVQEFRPEFYVVMGFCGLGLIVIFLQFFLFIRMKERVRSDEIMRAFSVSLIVIAVVALLGVGYSDKQVQPAITLFGTLMGYLLGQGQARSRTGVRPTEGSSSAAGSQEKSPP